MPPDAQPRGKGGDTRGGGRKAARSSDIRSTSQAGEESKSPKSSNTAQAKPASIREAPKVPRAGAASPFPRSKQKVQHASKQTASKWTRLGAAKKKLEEAARKLEGLLPLDLMSSQREKMESIKGSADINALAESLGSIIEVLMRDRDIEEAPSGLSLIKIWVKKALPFIEHGLDVATVSSPLLLLKIQDVVPAPYGLLVSGVLFAVQVCICSFLTDAQRLKNMSEVPEKIENALTNISSALSGIGISDDFPRSLSQELLDDIRASAILLTVAIMDCLSAVIKWTNGNGFLCIFCLIS